MRVSACGCLPKHLPNLDLISMVLSALNDTPRSPLTISPAFDAAEGGFSGSNYACTLDTGDPVYVRSRGIAHALRVRLPRAHCFLTSLGATLMCSDYIAPSSSSPLCLSFSLSLSLIATRHCPLRHLHRFHSLLKCTNDQPKEDVAAQVSVLLYLKHAPVAPPTCYPRCV